MVIDLKQGSDVGMSHKSRVTIAKFHVHSTAQWEKHLLTCVPSCQWELGRRETGPPWPMVHGRTGRSSASKWGCSGLTHLLYKFGVGGLIPTSSFVLSGVPTELSMCLGVVPPSSLTLC